MLINSEAEQQQKEKISSKEFVTEDVKIYSLGIPIAMFDKLKYENWPGNQSLNEGYDFDC